MSLRRKLALTGLSALLAGAGCSGSQTIEDTVKPKVQYQEPVKVEEPIYQLKKGDLVPNLTLNSIDGKEIYLSDLSKKKVILDFWSLGCGPCQELTPVLKEMYDNTDRNKLEIILIATRDKKEDVVKRFKEKPVPFYVVSDEDRNLAKRYGVTALPTMILLEDGKVGDSIMGFGPMHVKFLENYVKFNGLNKD